MTGWNEGDARGSDVVAPGNIGPTSARHFSLHTVSMRQRPAPPSQLADRQDALLTGSVAYDSRSLRKIDGFGTKELRAKRQSELKGIS